MEEQLRSLPKRTVGQRLQFTFKKENSSELRNSNDEKSVSEGSLELMNDELICLALEHLIEIFFLNFKFAKTRWRDGSSDNLLFLSKLDEKKMVTLILTLITPLENSTINLKSLAKTNGEGLFLNCFEQYRSFRDSLSNVEELKNSEIREIIICTNANFEGDLICTNSKNFNRKICKPKDNSKIKTQIFRDLKKLNKGFRDEEIEEFITLLSFVMKCNKKDLKGNTNTKYEKFLMDVFKNLRNDIWISKENLLDSILDVTVIFQGWQEINLKKLINYETVDDSHILSLALNEKLPQKIGKIININQNYSYVERMLSKSMKIDADVLKENQMDFFIISFKQSDDLNFFKEKYLNIGEIFELLPYCIDTTTTCRFYYSYKNYRTCDFQEFFPYFGTECSEDTQNNFHYLIYEDEELKWEHSIGNVDLIQRYFIESEDARCINENNFLDTKQYMIINGISNSGKSEFLRSIVKKFMDKQEQRVTPLWICNIDLIYFSENVLKEFNNEELELQNVLNFFFECEEIKDEFSKVLFLHFLYNNRVVLVFDNFDKFSFDIQMNISNLLKCIKEKLNIKQIWITSCPSFVGTLERSFGVYSYELKEIAKERRDKFIFKYWKEKAETSSDLNKLEFNAKNLIKTVSLTKNALSFGVPLHLRMLAAVFEDQVYLKEPFFPKCLTLFDLYERYSYVIHPVLYTDCMNAETDEDESIELTCKNFTLWQNKPLISEELMSIVNNCSSTSKSFIEASLKVLLTARTNNHFSHCTFREYFLGIFLANCVINLNDKSVLKAIKEILLKCYNNEFVRCTFDMRLCQNIDGCKIFRYTMLENEEQISIFTEEELHRTDPIGRGHLYYALYYHNINALRMLIQKNINLVFEPFFLEFFEGYQRKKFERYFSYVWHKTVKALNEMELKHLCYREIMIYVLKKTSKESCPKGLQESINVKGEMELGHWDIVKLCFEKLDYELKSVAELNGFMGLLKKFKCSPETSLLITFKAFDTLKINASDLPIATYCMNKILDYEGTDLYLFMCDQSFLNKFQEQFLLANKDVAEKFAKKLTSNFLKKLQPLRIKFGEVVCVSDYIDSIKKRSHNFSVLLKYFLRNGGKIFIFKRDFYKILKELNCIQVDESTERDEKLHDILFDMRVKDLYSLNCHSQINKEDILKVLQEYKNLADFNETLTISQSLNAIVYYILKNCDGIKLLELSFDLQNAILERKFSQVSEYFDKAKELGFLQILTKFSFEFGENVEQLISDYIKSVDNDIEEIVNDIDEIVNKSNNQYDIKDL
ncbi:UNVERIFIED_CONTAM: hypothetical protein RMT77_003864 [Armadillidium vulgare]